MSNSLIWKDVDFKVPCSIFYFFLHKVWVVSKFLSKSTKQKHSAYNSFWLVYAFKAKWGSREKLNAPWGIIMLQTRKSWKIINILFSSFHKQTCQLTREQTEPIGTWKPGPHPTTDLLMKTIICKSAMCYFIFKNIFKK